MYSKRSSRPAFHSRKNLAGFELIAAGVVATEKKYVIEEEEILRIGASKEGASTSSAKRSKVDTLPQEVVCDKEEKGVSKKK